MKRLITTILSAILTCGMAFPAMAEETNPVISHVSYDEITDMEDIFALVTVTQNSITQYSSENDDMQAAAYITEDDTICVVQKLEETEYANGDEEREYVQTVYALVDENGTKANEVYLTHYATGEMTGNYTTVKSTIVYREKQNAFISSYYLTSAQTIILSCSVPGSLSIFHSLAVNEKSLGVMDYYNEATVSSAAVGTSYTVASPDSLKEWALDFNDDRFATVFEHAVKVSVGGTVDVDFTNRVPNYF